MRWRAATLRVWRQVAAALSVAGLLLPAFAGAGFLLPVSAGAAEDPGASKQDVDDRLEDAREGLTGVETRQRAAFAELAEIDARRVRLDERLAVLGAELAGAQRALDAAEAALARTAVQLAATQARLAATRADLAHAQQVFAGRVRSSYMYGGSGYATTMLDVRDVTEFGRTVSYIRAVMASDRRHVEHIAALEATIQAEIVQLGRLRDRRAEQRAVAVDERDRVAGLVAREQALRDQVEAEAQRHRLVLAQLEADRASHVALVGALEAESARLEAELRRRAAEEARRRAEAEEARLRAARASRQPAAARAATAPAAPARQGRLLWPANGPKTSDFGWRTHPIFGTRRFHAGIDIGAGYGAPIWAAADGVVVAAGARGGYGNTVVIDHAGALATLYAHQARIAARPGQAVTRGQVIGYVGSTGYSTGPHLHFETREHGTPVDPMRYF